LTILFYWILVIENTSIFQEGPLIHIGAMVGGSVVEAWWKGFRNGPGRKVIGPLQNDRERRDMMAAGAAAGLSAAFGSPVGKYIILIFKKYNIYLVYNRKYVLMACVLYLQRYCINSIEFRYRPILVYR